MCQPTCSSQFSRPSSWKLQAAVTKADVFSARCMSHLQKSDLLRNAFFSQLVAFHRLHKAVGIPREPTPDWWLSCCQWCQEAACSGRLCLPLTCWAHATRCLLSCSSHWWCTQLWQQKTTPYCLVCIAKAGHEQQWAEVVVWWPKVGWPPQQTTLEQQGALPGKALMLGWEGACRSHWDAEWLSGCYVKDVQFAGMWKELFSQGLGGGVISAELWR